MFSKTYEIFSENVSPLRKIVEKQNKRAEKLGLEPINLLVYGHKMVTSEDGVTVDEMVTIEIIGDTPTLPGFEFVATLQHGGPEIGNIIRTIPTFEGNLPEWVHTADPGNCDQCHKFRRRNDTYIVKNLLVDESVAYSQVGSNCLQDFIGTDKVHAAATMAEIVSLIHEAAEGFGENREKREENTLLLDSALAWAAEAMFRGGWISRTKARETGEYATVDRALNAIRLKEEGERCTWKCALPCMIHFSPTKKAIDFSTKVLEWVPGFIERKLREDQDNDYIWNLSVVFKSDVIVERSYGLAASILGVYQRELEYQAKMERARLESVSEWQGTIGEKLVKTLTTKAFRFLGGMYPSTLITFEDAEKNLYKWFSSGTWEPTLDETKTYTMKVKDHKEWNGVKETHISHVKEYESPEDKKARKAQAKILKESYELLLKAAEEEWEKNPGSEEYKLAQKRASEAYREWQDVK